MVGLTNSIAAIHPVNSRIKVYEERGTVRYVGEVKGHPGTWVGVEWDDSSRGKHDGMINGIRYFKTSHPTAGSMIRPEKIPAAQSLEEAITDRYLVNVDNPLDENLRKEAQAYCQASIFEVVGMEKLARKQSHIEDLTDISVANSAVNCAGTLDKLRNLTTLNLTSTLVWNWKTLADIARQIPTVQYLNLSCNLLTVPDELEIVDLEPNFRHVRHINLRKCGLKDWDVIMRMARLWPGIESLALQENEIEKITSEANTEEIFCCLQELDLHLNKLSNFDEVCKLGNIKTLQSLFLMDNGIETLMLPDCDHDLRLSIFSALEKLNLNHNNFTDEVSVFNELDKLSELKNLSASANKKEGYEETLSNGIALISQLKHFNKMEITKEQRRGAEYDIWKRYGLEWQQTELSPEKRKAFSKKYRCYPRLVKKYGSPADFLIRPPVKVSNLLQIKILNRKTGEMFEKKVPRKISVQTLQGLIIKYFKAENTMPKLSYVDARYPKLVVELENMSKNLDYYSVQEGDIVTIDW